MMQDFLLSRLIHSRRFLFSALNAPQNHANDITRGRESPRPRGAGGSDRALFSGRGGACLRPLFVRPLCAGGCEIAGHARYGRSAQIAGRVECAAALHAGRHGSANRSAAMLQFCAVREPRCRGKARAIRLPPLRRANRRTRISASPAVEALHLPQRDRSRGSPRHVRAAPLHRRPQQDRSEHSPPSPPQLFAPPRLARRSASASHQRSHRMQPSNTSANLC